MRSGKHVKVKKRKRQDDMNFRANAQKLILGNPRWHLSFN